MRVYRKVDTDLWDDERFLSLSESAKWVWLALLTGPQTTPVPGLQIADHLVLASTLRRDPREVMEDLAEIETLGMCETDLKLRIIRLPKAVKRNPPENPNQLKAMWKSWKAMPDSRLKFAHIAAIQEAGAECGEWFMSIWKETFGTVTETVTETVREAVQVTVAQTTARAQQEHSKSKQIPGAASPAGPTNVQATQLALGAEASSLKKPKSEPKQPAGHNAILSVYCAEWVAARRPLDGKPPVISKADIKAASELARLGAVDEMARHIRRFVVDPDQWIAGRGYLLRDLPSRLNAYRQSPSSTHPATAQGWAAPTKPPTETHDATSKL